MDLKSLVETVFQMEEDLDLFNKKVDGVYFWELVRFSVVNQIAQKTGLYGEAHTGVDVDAKNVISYSFSALKNFLYRNPFISSENDVLFFGHPRRKLMEDGLWWDVYCDPVIDFMQEKYKCLLLEPPYLNGHLLPAKTESIRFLDSVLFLSNVLKIILSFKFALTKDENLLIDKIQALINKKFNIDIDLNHLVRDLLLVRKSRIPIYSFLLNKIKPKVVILTVSYGRGISPIIEVCKNMGIPVVELQHGTISRYHTGYSFPNVKKLKRFPDYFLTFGDYWKHIVDLPIPGNQIISAGYPFFEMEVAKYKNEPVKDQIVFISQGTIGKEMSKFAAKLQSRNDFNMDIIYKLHPGEYDRWEQEYPWLVDSGMRVVSDDSEPVYRLLAQSKAIVGVYSTLVYEALGLGLRTFLLDLPGVEYMEELIESGSVNVVSSVDELIEKFYQQDQVAVNDCYFFKHNALLNIKHFLWEIVQDGKYRHSIKI